MWFSDPVPPMFATAAAVARIGLVRRAELDFR
jgi:hypothetical protein